MRPLIVVLVLVLVAAATEVAGGAERAPTQIVASVTDGDTLRLTDGRRVRLLQIDAPDAGECYYSEARAALTALAAPGTSVVLETDSRLDTVDRYGRLLRYLRRGRVDVNLELVRRGAAAPYFYEGERGRKANRLLGAARAAKSAKRGLWAASPSTVLDPERQVDTERCGSKPAPLVPPRGGCDPNYIGGCVPPYPPDVDCAEIRRLGIAPVRVIGSDPHGLDGEGDGLGCE